MKIIIMAFLLCGFSAGAQSITTNWVQAAPNFREVNGKLYNVDRSTNWITLLIEPNLLLTNGVTAWKYKATYAGGRYMKVGNDLVWHSFTNAPEIDYEIGIKNCPPLPEGKTAIIRAFPIGVQQVAGRALESYDYGLPHLVPVRLTNSIAGK